MKTTVHFEILTKCQNVLDKTIEKNQHQTNIIEMNKSHNWEKICFWQTFLHITFTKIIKMASGWRHEPCVWFRKSPPEGCQIWRPIKGSQLVYWGQVSWARISYTPPSIPPPAHFSVQIFANMLFIGQGKISLILGLLYRQTHFVTYNIFQTAVKCTKNTCIYSDCDLVSKH